MNKENLFGELISPDSLKINKAQRVFQYITSTNNSYLELLEIWQKNNHSKETIVIVLNVERPQKVKIDIKRKETIAISFSIDDIFPPQVLMLREDFPVTPH